MSGQTHIKRARTFEAWLRKLITTYQDRRLKPRDRAYSNLTSLTRPTQMYAITLKQGAGSVAVVVVCHCKEVRNGVARAVRVDSMEELAEFSGVADDYFGTGGLLREDWASAQILLRPLRVGEEASIVLARQARQALAHPRLRPGVFSAGMKQAVQVLPPAALWVVRYRAPFPEPRSVLLELERPRRRRAARAVPAEEGERRPPAEVPAICYAAFSEPIVWFGPPPYPSPRETIMRRPWLPMRTQRLLHRALVADIETFVYNNGLILAATDNGSRARSTINQVFAVLTRSGVALPAVADFELIEVTGFDAESGELRGYKSVATRRNRLLDMRPGDQEPNLSFSLPEEIVAPLLDLADQCARDHDQAVASLRLLNAFTLFDHEFWTEAFVTAWTLIETSIERDFEAFWLQRGRSKTAIGAMDWTASQQIDLLFAVGKLDATLGEQIHSLRKRRNAIVHDLAEATRQEVLDCIGVAADMTPLPTFPEPLRPQRVLL